MAGKGPDILVVADDRQECGRIAAILRDSGFGALEASDGAAAGCALRGADRVAAIVAFAAAGEDGGALLRALRRENPDLPAVLVLDRPAMQAIEADRTIALIAPLDHRRLLDSVIDLVMDAPEDTHRGAPGHGAAELGIAAAMLACLRHRRALAAAAGAICLERDLARRIAEILVLGGEPAIAALPG